MRNIKSKLIILSLVFILGLVLIQTSVEASNKNIQILGKSNGDYIIYIKDNLSKDFEFAFSNDTNANKEMLEYTSSETDSTQSDANKVAYVNSATIGMFSKPTYMWVRIGENYILEGVQVDLSKAINEYDLQYATSLTKQIEVDTTKTNTIKKIIDGKDVITTVGKVILTNPNQNLNYSYILIELPNSDKYNKFMDLATRISKFNSATSIYTKIEVYNEFLNYFYTLTPDIEDNWVNVQENEILQPEDSKDGEQYILWIRESENEQTQNIDVQFLTSHKEYSEERIKETITTKLPVTYDNNILLIVFGVLIVAIIIVYIRIKTLNRKEK